MDYKEKYEQALERAKELHKDAITLQLEQDIKDYEYIFPELKESEDERIKKALVRFHKSSIDIDGIKGEDILAWLEKQGEQKDFIPKEEPKFKVGDWIVFNGLTLYVKEVVKGFYRTTSKGGITNSYDWDIDNAARLWTIQDAKDGDVLRLGCIIAMFKKYIGQEKCICYCSISEDGDFEIPIENGEDNVYGCTDTTPATKEQRELVFTKMKEVGYKWDAEKKELKKIHVIDEGKSEMDYCFTKMMNGEKVSPIWSEEDERICHAIICDIANDKSICKFEISKSVCDEQINWLKSLKERIGG